ncbi:MAG: YafY family protein [Candidatus Dormiibacterota bacterium]
MRADRLVATLLVLQARGRITAAELAAELEVSERTARRDLEALSMAGIPVYAQQGRGGGWSLLGGARTDLTGLTAAEARALFLVAGPAVTLTPELGAALRKLVRALPEPFRPAAELAGRAVLHDSADWDRPSTRVPPPAHLTPLQNAVIDGVQVRLRYAGRDSAATERMVHPLGLVAKGPTWYLVANTDAGLGTFLLSRIQSLEVTTQPAQRPTGFDLDAAWRSTMATLDERRLPFSATVRADADFVPVLRYVLGTRASLQLGGLLRVRGPSIEILAAQLAGFAEHIEVLKPEEVRTQLARLGVALTRSYGRKQMRAKLPSGSFASPL